MTAQENSIKEIVKILAEAKKVLFFTGAGISTPSGIPDFRSPRGLWEKYNVDFSLWEKYNPDEYATLRAFKRKPEKVWQFIREMYKAFDDVKPNPAHDAITAIQELVGKQKVFIATQNIDQLHQKSGSTNVYEVHGSINKIHCVRCHYEEKLKEEQHLEIEPYPQCPKCNSPLKPKIVFFGEFLPSEEFEPAMEIAKECDVAVGVGTSLEVYPAADLILLAPNATKILFNYTPTSHQVDYFVQGDVAETLPEIVKLMMRK